MELCADFPTTRVWVRNEFLFNHERGRGKFTEAHVFAVRSIPARALSFDVMLRTGAHFRGIPLNAIVHEVPPDRLLPLEDLCLWDCFSPNIVVIQFAYLLNHRAIAMLRTREKVCGDYMATIEWLPTNGVDTTFCFDPEQSKCAHILKLDTGQFAALPTNRILFTDGYFIGPDPTAHKEGYLTCTRAYYGETCEKWAVANDAKVFYGQDDKNQKQGKSRGKKT